MKSPPSVMPPIASDGWMTRERALMVVLLTVTAIAFYLCYRLVLPFLPALAWALALAVVARPLHAWLAERIGAPNVAAGLAVGIVAFALLVPALFVVNRVVHEATAQVESFQAEGAGLRWRRALEDNPRLAATIRWVEDYVHLGAELRRLAAAVAPTGPDFVTGSVWAFMQGLVTLFILFYLFRDRRKALDNLRGLVPLSDRETDAVFARVANTIHATVYGTVVVALVQGTLGGLMFWWLGLPAPMLWGLVMGLLAIIPYLGAFVVWVPAAVLLALEGDWTRALILTAWGGIVVALIDNLLYPILVGDRLRMHVLPVFFAILGGLAVFGASGVILGPVVLAVTVAIVDTWRRRTAGGRTAEEGVHA